MLSLDDELRWRDALSDTTEGLHDVLVREKVTAYAGFDPTASSLHVGSLMPIMALARAQRLGHSPIAVVGGGTGLIGDPSGKSAERTLQTPEQVEENVAGIRAQLERFLDFDVAGNPARLVNNADWLTRMSAMDFLRDVGKYFTVNYMLAKESVKRRLGSEDGISYTEFSYLLLQAYDFLELHERFNCTVQIGGSDQWGNIVAGIDLIRRLKSAKAHGLVLPLVTTAAGTKFGKTEAGTVWLDGRRTSPFRFYQFWLNADDADALRYLKYFTFMDQSTIDGLAAEMAAAPERRDVQRALAREVTALVHGAEHVTRAERASRVLFSEDITTLSATDVLEILDEAPSTDVAANSSPAIVDVLVLTGLAASKGDARRLVVGGGVYVNNRAVTDPNHPLDRAQAIGGQVLVLRKGKRQQHVIKLQ